MTETKEEYAGPVQATLVAGENVENVYDFAKENAQLRAQNAQLQSEVSSLLALVHAYEIAADCVRSAAAVLPRLVKQEAESAK